jgi:molecular chaperone DnaK (HSP70)
MAIALDFGTSNTVVSRWNPVMGQPETLSLPEIGQPGSPALIPSLLYVKDASQGQVFVGQQVRDRGLDVSRDNRFFRNFKRGIGNEFQGFLPELDGQLVSFERVGEWFLQAVLTGIGQVPLPLDDLVLTVPVDSFERYRLWLGQAFRESTVAQIRLLDEPTAAALGYGVADQDLLLVIDFGGGTLDLALVKLDRQLARSASPMGFILKWGEKRFAESSAQRPRLAKVLAKAGLNLGGADLDHWVSDFFVASQSITPSRILTRLAEKIKIQLSSQLEAEEIYFDDESFDAYTLRLSRPEFEALLKQQGFFEQLDTAMSQVLQQSRRLGLEPTDIGKVLLVGGSTQIPAVQTWVEQYFERARIRSDRPFEAIAQGALQLTQGTQVEDFLYHSYGIRYWNHRRQCHDWHPLIQAGQAYPMVQPVELVLGASVANQPSIELVIGELGDSRTATEVFFDGDRLVTRTLNSGQQSIQPLNDRDGARTIARLDPLGTPGIDRIRLRFWVDQARFLRLTVEDLLGADTLLDNQAVVQLS